MAFFKKKVSAEVYIGEFLSKTKTTEYIRSSDPGENALGFLGLDMLASLLYRKHGAAEPYYRLVKALLAMPEQHTKNLLEVSQVLYQSFQSHYQSSSNDNFTMVMQNSNMASGIEKYGIITNSGVEFARNHVYARNYDAQFICAAYSKIGQQSGSKSKSDLYFDQCLQAVLNLNSNFKIR